MRRFHKRCSCTHTHARTRVRTHKWWMCGQGRNHQRDGNPSMWLQLQFFCFFFHPSIDGRSGCTFPARQRVRLVHFRSPSQHVKKEGSAVERLAGVRLICLSLEEQGGRVAAVKAFGPVEDQFDVTRCLNTGGVSAFTCFPLFLPVRFHFSWGCNCVGKLDQFLELTWWKHFMCYGARKGDAQTNKMFKMFRCH